MINDEIRIALAQCKIPERQILEYNFEDIAYIQKEDCGVYVIHQDQRPIYVGKGKVKKRNISHWMKTNGRVKVLINYLKLILILSLPLNNWSIYDEMSLM